MGLAGTSTSLPYDCEMGFAQWETAWSPVQQQFCCSTMGRGCTTALPETTPTIPSTPPPTPPPTPPVTQPVTQPATPSGPVDPIVPIMPIVTPAPQVGQCRKRSGAAK